MHKLLGIPKIHCQVLVRMHIDITDQNNALCTEVSFTYFIVFKILPAKPSFLFAKVKYESCSLSKQ